MWDVARHGDSGWRRAVLTETGALKHPPRTTNLAGLPLGPGETPDLRFLIGVRTERYPKEYRNLAGDPAHARVEALLRQALQQVRACRGAGCAVPLPEELRAGP